MISHFASEEKYRTISSLESFRSLIEKNDIAMRCQTFLLLKQLNDFLKILSYFFDSKLICEITKYELKNEKITRYNSKKKD